MDDLTKRRIEQSDRNALKERPTSPLSVQTTKASRLEAAVADNEIHMAYCAEDAPEGNVIKCFLEVQATAEWNPSLTYARDHAVLYEEEGYISLKNGNTGNQPDTGEDADAWNEEETYSIDEVVKVGDDIYVSLANDNLGNDPAESPEWWELWAWWDKCDKISVHCEVCPGEDLTENLNTSVPRLIIGKRLIIFSRGGYWYHFGSPFQSSQDCDEEEE